MDKILIRGLEVSACHGVHAYEKTKPQKFVFDADICLSFYAAATEDDLKKTCNYSEICNLICGVAEGNTFNLIEKLAYECAFAVMEKFPVSEISLTVYKPQAPVKHPFENVGVSVCVKRERAILSLGSSMGDREGNLKKAIAALGGTRGVKVIKTSSVIKTEPYGGVAENEFLNMAAEVETYLSPRALLDVIHKTEADCGRTRDKRWADRTLDIDIIFFGNRVIEEEGLIIPHPEYFKRDFVLQPVMEIAPDFVCPLTHRRMRDI